ncbi:TonB-dependent receptor [Novosphingobium flavum]|uniref:TonB-dependent receptor n=1 Tax=Novosphingobium flavum TaxID=1778672 RepID=A0A7X1FQN3_9SPHN|nr:TonB-dependent receptor [Novosphingobium flavum]MBC2665179.1 TonB-dependent receptor [Novosphingobium flavum]
MSQVSSLPVHRKGARRWIGLSLAATVAPVALLAGTAHAAEAVDDTSGDIVVTAQRRDENLSKVPLSIAAYSQKDMDAQGIRSISDIARITPALQFTSTAGVVGNNGTNIAIRGLKSDVGSSTTAIYLDDTPIQIRNIGYFGGNPYPRVFDLDRVEVLRGPQGTLFGASSEGGAVRFITPSPSFTKTDIYARSQFSVTEHGAPSYEAGLAMGGPISETVAARGSVWYQHVGGYVDQVTQGTDNVSAKDVNYQDNIVARAALTWKPTENLTFTPKIFYQNLYQNARDDFWQGYGSPAAGDYHTGVYTTEPTKDRMLLPSLGGELKLGKVTVVSNTSYLKRDLEQTLNYATYFSTLRSGTPFGTYANKDITNMDDFLTLKQSNFSQELRAFSYNNPLVDWSVGAYYQHSIQDYSNYTSSGRIPGVLVSGFQQYQGRYSLVDIIKATDSQYAGFGSVDIKPTSKLTLTAAVRYTKVDSEFVETKDGSSNLGVRTTVRSANNEGSWTPKFAAKYQVNDDAMLYTAVSKGFRPAGSQPSTLPESCAANLATLGLTTSTIPTTYKSDSMWSYEVGSKGRLFGGKLAYDVSGYAVDWKNIQQAVRMNCGFVFVSNLGNAKGKGAELSLEAKPVQGVTVGGNVGYTDIHYAANVYQSNGILLRAAGERINGPLWTGHAYANFEAPISSSTDGYARVDYTFTSTDTIPSAVGTFGYDAALYALPGKDYVQLRVGLRKGGVDASLFIDNLTNSRDLLGRGHDSSTGTLFYAQSYRPRTFGLTLQFRN